MPGLEPTSKILIHNFRQVGQWWNAKPNGNLGEGDLDAWSWQLHCQGSKVYNNCRIWLKKRNLHKLSMADSLWETALSLHHLLITYMIIASDLSLWLLSLAFWVVATMCESRICWILMLFQPGKANIVFSIGIEFFGGRDISNCINWK